MVETFNQTGKEYDYAQIYSQIYDNYVAKYPSLYYSDNKPVICFFNNENLTDHGVFPKDDTFNVIVVGQESYTQWIYTDVNYADLPQHQPQGETSVTPRYDESHLQDRAKNVTVDIYLNESTYDNEWNNAIQQWRQGKIDTILISSWNEYPERTAIEPHYDTTASNQSTHYLYDKTKYYIDQLQQSKP